MVIQLVYHHKLSEIDTLRETNISHPRVVGKTSFFFHWWDMLVLWGVFIMSGDIYEILWYDYNHSIPLPNISEKVF